MLLLYHKSSQTVTFGASIHLLCFTLLLVQCFELRIYSGTVKQWTLRIHILASKEVALYHLNQTDPCSVIDFRRLTFTFCTVILTFVYVLFVSKVLKLSHYYRFFCGYGPLEKSAYLLRKVCLMHRCIEKEGRLRVHTKSILEIHSAVTRPFARMAGLDWYAIQFISKIWNNIVCILSSSFESVVRNRKSVTFISVDCKMPGVALCRIIWPKLLVSGLTASLAKRAAIFNSERDRLWIEVAYIVHSEQQSNAQPVAYSSDIVMYRWLPGLIQIFDQCGRYGMIGPFL